MRATFRFGAVFLLLLLMNLLWQFPDVPLPLLHETDPLNRVAAWLQPWLFAIVPLLRRLPEQLYSAIFGLSFFGASIPAAALLAAISLTVYYLLLRTIQLIPALRRIGSRIPAAVFVSVYVALFCVYSASCGYITYTRFPRVQDDDGNLITLAPSERAQIQRIIASRGDIHKPLYMMTLHDDGYGECYSVEYRVGDDYFVTSYNLVRQQGGIWHLDERTIRQVKGEPVSH